MSPPARCPEAFQWMGAPLGIREPEWATDAAIERRIEHGHGYLVVQGRDGPLRAYPGDWIVRDGAGDLYPTKASAFARPGRPAPDTGAPERTDRGGAPVPGA